MTTYGEAVQMGIGANLAVVTLNEVNCAGEALANYYLNDQNEVRDDLSPETKAVLTHVMRHLTAIRDVANHLDIHYDKGISAFDDANPGKLLAVSREISEMPLIKELQDIIGMTDQEREVRKNYNLSELSKKMEAKQN